MDIPPRQVRVVAYDPEWPRKFEAEADRIARVLEDVVVHLHHIGSTAIPGIRAKPIIDILAEVVGLPLLDERAPAIEVLGYQAMGEFGIPQRRYFRRNDASGIRTNHLHAFEVGSIEIDRHLAFRDYMTAHPLAAQAYGALKQRLASQHSDDMKAYVDGKDAFVKEHVALALAWRTSFTG